MEKTSIEFRVVNIEDVNLRSIVNSKYSEILHAVQENVIEEGRAIVAKIPEENLSGVRGAIGYYFEKGSVSMKRIKRNEYVIFQNKEIKDGEPK